MNNYLKNLHNVICLPLFQLFLMQTFEIPPFETNAVSDVSLIKLKKLKNSENFLKQITTDLKPLFRGVVLFDSSPETQFELALKKDEIVDVLNQMNEDWYYVKTENNEIGYCPVSYLKSPN